MLRSWNSSNTTADTPSSDGSERSILAKIPSVKNTILEFSPYRFSKRTCHPTSSRISKSAPTERASILAATRRGWSTRTLPPNFRSSMTGSPVDLPEPVGADTTNRLFPASAAA